MQNCAMTSGALFTVAVFALVHTVSKFAAGTTVMPAALVAVDAAFFRLFMLGIALLSVIPVLITKANTAVLFSNIFVNFI